MFDRQIQNMEVNNNFARIQERVGLSSGVLGGAAAGALTGSMAGPIGIGIGAASGATASLVGGIADLALNEQLRQETMGYTKDMREMNMQNIRALPNTLSKVDAFNQQNKCFPFVEFYDCTEEEKRNLCYRIKYSGMTINRIGTLSEYVNSWSYPSQAGGDDKYVIVFAPYIKGQIILSSGVDTVEDWDVRDDYHLINTIANEISRGVYFI